MSNDERISLKEYFEKMMSDLSKQIDRIESTGTDTNEKIGALHERVGKLENLSTSSNHMIQVHDKILLDKEDGLISWKDKIIGSMATIKVLYPIVALIITTLVTSLFGLWVYKIKDSIIEETVQQTTLKPEAVVKILEDKYNLEIYEN